MPEFAWPWLLLALPLPWLAARALPAARSVGAALRAPWSGRLAGLAAGRGRALHARPQLLPLLIWSLLCLAAARPQELGPVAQPPRSGRDLMLAVDLSGSMAEEDMRLGQQPVDRLTAVKAVLGDFLERRAGDRVGLLVFGQRAYTVTPLTFDRESVRQQLADTVVGLAGRETAIGDAIALAVKRLREPSEGERSAVAGEHAEDGLRAGSRVIVLLTDGVNTAGAIEPAKAAELAALDGVRVHAIGFGGEGGGLASLFGLNLPLPGAQSEIDEASLRALAEHTGGRYFRARDIDELAGIYAELDRIEPAAHAGERLRPRIERYAWPLAAALLLSMLALLPWPARRPA